MSRLLAVIGLVTLTASAAWAVEPVRAEYPGLEAIQATGLMKTVEYLASPQLAGRLAGGPGYMTAAREMAARFRRLGLRPAGERGFFQPLEIEYD